MKARNDRASGWSLATTLLLAWAVCTISPLELAAQVTDSRRVAALTQRIQEADLALEQLAGRVPPKIDALRELMDRLHALQPPRKKEEVQKPEEKPAKQVRFRPPLVRATEKAPSLVFVCENDRATVINMKSMNKLLEDDIGPKFQGGSLSQKGTVPIPNCHFDLDYEIVDLVIYKMLSYGVERKPGHDGESVEQVQASSSELQRALAAADPQKDYLQISVYPDSFEVFRVVRSIAWQRKFDVRWIPLGSTEKLRFGGGQGTTD